MTTFVILPIFVSKLKIVYLLNLLKLFILMLFIVYIFTLLES